MSFTSPTPARCAPGLGMCQVDDATSHVHRGQVAERPVAKVDVVVDRFRDAHHGDRQPTPADLFADRVGAAMRAVTADAKQHVDSLLLEKVDHHPHVLRSARRSQHRPPLVVDLADEMRG